MVDVKIALGLLQQDETFLLQLRNHSNSSGGTGLVGLFGGTLEPGEKPLDTVCRELAEETTFKPSKGEALELGDFNVESDYKRKKALISATIFSFIIDESIEVDALEGDIIKWSKDEVSRNDEKLTPATREVFTRLTKGEDGLWHLASQT